MKLKLKLSRILTLIAALGLLGSAVETVPSSVQPAEVAAAQKKTAKKKKTKKSTSKSKKKSKKPASKPKKKTVKKTTSKPKKKTVKKTTSKPKKKTVKKTTSKPKKKTVKKTTSKPKKMAKKTTSKSKKKTAKKTTSKSKKKTAKKTTSKSKKKTLKTTTSKSKKKSVKKPASKPTTNSKTNQPPTKPSTDQPSTKPSTEQPADKPSTNQPSTEQPSTKPSTDQPADKPENSSSVKESKDADHYKPIAGELDVGVAVGDPLPWSWLISNENELPSGTKLKFDKEPDLNKVGTYHIKVIAQYPDGSENSSDTIQVRVRPKTDAEIYEPKVKDLEFFEGEYRSADECITNKEELPKGTKFVFNPYDGFETVGIHTTRVYTLYPDGSRDESRSITVKVDSVADAVSVKAFDELKSPTERYIMLKVTNKSGKTLDIDMDAEPKDGHGKDLGRKDDKRGPIAPNQSVILWRDFWDERPYYFDHIDYHLNLTESVKKSANSDLKVEVAKNKGFGYDIKATNIGTKKIYYPSVDVFLFKDGKVIYEHETLMEPDDADGLQPGESITKSFQSDDYDDIEFSYTSSYDK